MSQIDLPIELTKPMTQRDFADLVGISPRAVRDLVARRILFTGQTGEVWLLRYLLHLHQARSTRLAGRGY
jgi:hypothetical protein